MPSSPPRSTLFPYTTLFRSAFSNSAMAASRVAFNANASFASAFKIAPTIDRSEEHTSELQSLRHLVCRLPHRDLHSFPTRRSSDLPSPTRPWPRRASPSTPTPLSRPLSKSPRPSTDRKSTRLNSSHLGISYAVFPTAIYTLSLHDALPICLLQLGHGRVARRLQRQRLFRVRFQNRPDHR